MQKGMMYVATPGGSKNEGEKRVEGVRGREVNPA